MRCLAIITVAVIVVGCGDHASTDVQGYYEWMNDPSNGCVRTSTVNGLRLELKYLAPAYLRYQRERSDSSVVANAPGNDSTVCFLMSIAPADSTGGDIMLRGVASDDDFTSRAMNLNFEIKDMVSINYGGHRYPVLLATLENVYGLSKKRDVMLVFPKIQSYWKEDGDADLVFDDRIFDTGISHFAFHIRDLNRAPASIHS
jgi:hypothetical protein